MNTLLYLKWVTNKVLLYSSGNSTQCYTAAQMRGEFGGEWIHVYVWLNSFAVHFTWQLRWEGSLGENGYMYMYGWIPLLSTWNSHNTANQLYSNIKLKVWWRGGNLFCYPHRILCTLSFLPFRDHWFLKFRNYLYYSNSILIHTLKSIPKVHQHLVRSQFSNS